MTNEEVIDFLARMLWFRYCDDLGWPNGMPTWEEMKANPKGPFSLRYSEFIERAKFLHDAIRNNGMKVVKFKKVKRPGIVFDEMD